ncbi:hypothetical protein N7463_009143 [Penicillium fimorum]|uniref:Uncharacterized protein n=1 Tax=Penicillium fimorum TaxID=1882269 RepID=A0A9X0C428_9EURO|nr:hypothetical protein N7463_009143 [Penicillium fimorum]
MLSRNIMIAALPDNLAETPKTCSMMSGTYEDMKWFWHSADSGCAIESQRDAISRAGRHYMTSKDNGEHY